MNTKIVGSIGENIATKYLKNKGYKIITNNMRNIIGEIDIICMKKDLIIFVEVKLRSSNLYGFPKDAVGTQKQNKIKKTAMLFLKENNLMDRKLRFDVIEIYIDQINHIENAF